MMSSNKKQKRIFRVELLRILAMLLIVQCHVAMYSKVGLNSLFKPVDGINKSPSIDNAINFLLVQFGQVGVSLFFIISGFFLCKKRISWQTIVKPWIRVLCYSVVILIIFLLLHLYTNILPDKADQFFSTPIEITRTTIKALLPIITNTYWFMTAYIVLLVLLPIINIIVKHSNKRQLSYLITIIVILDVWRLAGDKVYYYNDIVYATGGYLVGAYIRLYKYTKNIHLNRIKCLKFIILSIVAMLIFNYISLFNWEVTNRLGWRKQVKIGIQPLLILVAAIIFYYVVNRRSTQINQIINKRATRVCSILATSTLGVYLIHENAFIQAVIWTPINQITNPLANSNIAVKWLVMIAISVLIYAVCSVVAIIFEKLVVGRTSKFIINHLEIYFPPDVLE